MSERFAWCAVTKIDVADTPLDLGNRIGSPVASDLTHLGRWHRLRNSRSAAGVIVSLEVPVALSIPERIEARHLSA